MANTKENRGIISPTTRFWHPFADMAKVASSELLLERGQGVYVWDKEGRRYLDATAGLWYCSVGHGRTELAEVAARQMTRLAAYSAFGDLANEPAVQLAERISRVSPMEDTVVFFTSGGSESIETAAKLARRYWTVIGKPQKYLLVSRGGAYHGMAGYGTSLGAIELNTAGYGELVPGIIHIPPDDPQAFAKALKDHPNQVAAFFSEPVRAAAGVYPPPTNYWAEIQALCRKYEVLLVVDEVVTGFGRMGHWFGSSRFNIQPDLITGAKGVTSGYMPLGVVLCGPRVQEPFWRGNAGVFRHGYTYSGHATACAVGLANLDLIEKEKLVERVGALESCLAAELKRLNGHPMVQGTRCVGLTGAIEVSQTHRATNPGLADLIVSESRRHGVLTRSLVGQSLQISPPLVITEDEIRRMVAAFTAALDAVAEKMATKAHA